MKLFFLFTFFITVFISAQTETVYVTKTGSKYHLSSCSYLRSSSISMNLKEAVDEGYSPCSRCNPPTFSGSTSEKNSITPFPPKTDSKTKKQCVAITQKGTQCSRNAEDGSDYCWQHKKSTTTTKSSTTSTTGRTIYTGPRGGKYYINSKGNKVYIKK